MRKSSILLYVIVAASGAAVLALEILGTRILGPSFGVSLFLWSALITVTLAALAAGYLAGGAWADAGASYSRLCAMVGIAGAWITAIPWMQSAVLGIVDGWELRAAILGSSLILFFIPLMALGAVTPYAVRLSLSNVERAGRTTGRLFAVSTLASVFSALLTGFWLIPGLGVLLLTTVLGAGLLLIAAAAALAGRAGGRSAALSLLFGIAGVAAPLVSPVERADPENGLVAVRQSAYAEIRVFEGDGGRHLLIDRGIHTRIDPATGASTLGYSAVMEIPRRYFRSPGRMLLIGLGGGSLARSYSAAGWEVESVEIDPVVVAVAREHFGLDSAAGKVVEMDGRRFMAVATKRYDVVLLDAYGSSAIPFHLVTAEAFALARSVLNDGGVLAVNVISDGWHDPLLLDIAAALRTAFREVLALPTAEPPDRVGNVLLFAADRDLGAIPEPEANTDLDPSWRFGPGYAIAHAWDNRFTPATEGRAALTDDLNPVDVRSIGTMLAARREVRKYLGRQDAEW